MENSWKDALAKVCEIYYKSNKTIDWLIVGSVGSVLQGCNMEPGDIDIYVKHKEGVSQFAELLSEFSLTTKCDSQDSSVWMSSIEEPVFNETFPFGFSWTKARWKIYGFDVEVVHISNSAGIPDSTTGEGIWEGGQYIWSYSKQVNFGDYSIPVVPLEIQLESNLRRKRQDRVDSIITRLNEAGYDKELIEIALSTENLSYFNSKVVLSK